MDLILIPGLWLDASVWTETAHHLGRRGHRVDALTLPGQGDGDASATYDDQVAAVLTAVDRAQDRPYVVGHSAACTLAWAAADARAERLAGVALVGGFPVPDGGTYVDLPCQDGLVPFPGWEAFEGPDSADLDARARRRFEATMVPVPQAVARGRVRLRDDRRHDVPATLVCPEFSPHDVDAWVAAGDLPELAAARELSKADLDAGHWPMLSCPDRLAVVLATAAEAGRAPR